MLYGSLICEVFCTKFFKIVRIGGDGDRSMKREVSLRVIYLASHDLALNTLSCTQNRSILGHNLSGERIMKSLLRWGTALSLAGSIMVGSWLMTATRVLALTDEQVIESLQPVPVYTITNEEGSPLIVQSEEGDQQPATLGVFLSETDAEGFLSSIRSNDPELGNNMVIRQTSLARVYAFVRQAPAETPLRIEFIPLAEEVNAIRSILEENGRNPDDFRGVPLFVARLNDDEGGFPALIQAGDEELIPVFFRQEPLLAILEQVQAQDPELASMLTVQVLSLEGFIQILQETEAPENRFRLMPPDFEVEGVEQQPAQSAPPAQPTAPVQGQ
jgi:Tic22-like family